MITVYDVVKIVKPGAPTLIEPGRYLIDHCPNEEMARNHAQRCGEHTTIPRWVSFTVEPHDETCPGRAYLYRDREKYQSTDCTCTPNHGA